MRTTINIDDDLMNAIRSLAAERRQSLGTVISDLIRRGLRPEPVEAYSNDFPVFVVREGTPPITPEMVQSAMDES
jgi:ribbon-helix-helix CopG family protein